MIGMGHTTDIWKPEVEILLDNEISDARYILAQAGADCRFHEISSRQRMELAVAIDPSLDLQAVHFLKNAVDSLDQYFILKWLQEGTYWRVTAPVRHSTLPKEYWIAMLEQIKVIPDEIGDYYASHE